MKKAIDIKTNLLEALEEIFKFDGFTFGIIECELNLMLKQVCVEQREICKQAYYDNEEGYDIDMVIENAGEPNF